MSTSTSATSSPSTRTVIVAAIDATESAIVPDAAVSLAQKIPGAELHLLHVIPVDVVFPEGSVGPTMHRQLEDGRRYIDDVTSNVARTCATRICGHLAVGRISERILQLATDLEADFIVVGTGNKGLLERMAMGSVSAAIVKKAVCTVIVARPKGYQDENARLHVPQIEPPCKGCLDVQRATEGEKLWCNQHSTRHAHGLLHYESPQAFGVGSSLLRPEV